MDITTKKYSVDNSIYGLKGDNLISHFSNCIVQFYFVMNAKANGWNVTSMGENTCFLTDSSYSREKKGENIYAGDYLDNLISMKR